MKHMVISDTQVKPGVRTKHLKNAGKYAADKKPDVIVHIGDHWDMPSLSSYDKGKTGYEGRRYVKDIQAGNDALTEFMKPIYEEQKRMRKAKKKVWRTRLIFTIGNHEERIMSAVENDAMLEGLIGYQDFNLETHGWEVHPFLQPVIVDGVA